MAAEHCDCGSNLPLIARIGGRDSDMFYVELDGEKKSLSPVVFEHALTHVLDAREYQIVQEENTRFRVRVEPLPGSEFDMARAQSAIEKQLQDYELDGKLQFEVEVVDRLAGDGEKKFKRIVSKVADAEKKNEEEPATA
jgi:phenylacetate-coenzyme A ligase PaaK-like adenylate-forming protein